MNGSAYRAGPRPGRRPHHVGDGGFALPGAILALVAVGLLITGGIQIALHQQEAALSSHRETEALYIAESGMNAVLAQWSPHGSDLSIWGPPAVVEGAIGRGEWEAEIRRIGERLFFVRSTGQLSQPGGGARRSVGMATRLFEARFDVPGVLYTRGPVELTGEARIAGEDHVPAPWGDAICPEASKDLPAVVAVKTFSTNPADSQRSVAPAARGALTAHSKPARFGEMTWDELTSLASLHLEGGTIEEIGATVVQSECDHSDPLNWGDPERPEGPCGSYFPIVHLRNDAIIRSDGSGQGILLADGDLALEGSFRFFGLVIGRGSIDLVGEADRGPSVFGAIDTRNPHGTIQRFTGGSLVQNSSCAVRRATDNGLLTRMRPLDSRAWLDLSGASS